MGRSTEATARRKQPIDTIYVNATTNKFLKLAVAHFIHATCNQHKPYIIYMYVRKTTMEKSVIYVMHFRHIGSATAHNHHFHPLSMCESKIRQIKLRSKYTSRRQPFEMCLKCAKLNSTNMKNRKLVDMVTTITACDLPREPEYTRATRIHNVL